MELNNAIGAPVQNGTAKQMTRPSQNGQNKHAASAAKPETEKAKEPIAKAEAQLPVQLKPEVALAKLPETEPEELKVEQRPIVSVMTLESKLKLVEDLHRRSIQRLNLMARRKQLEAFEVALAQENDELEENPFQGCKLIIRDDKNREFLTTTPGLIRLVAQFIYDACSKKLVEIEATIVFP